MLKFSISEIYAALVLRRSFHNENKNYIGVHRVQAEKLQYNEKQEKRPWQTGNEKVLPFLQKTHFAQRNKVVFYLFQAWIFRFEVNVMAEAVNEKKAKIKKPSKFFKEVKSELKKVVWPSGKQVINNTLIVLALVILVGLFIYGLDSLFQFGLFKFIK